MRNQGHYIIATYGTKVGRYDMTPKIDIYGGAAKIQYLADFTLGSALDKFSN